MNLDNYYDKVPERRRNSYAVVIYLPKTLDDIVAPFREKYDPLYNLVAAHITLVFPFESNLSLDNLSTSIKSAVEGLNSFEIELESIGDFYPTSPVIYWDIKECQMLHDLYYKLYSDMSLPIPYKNYMPHVTIAREISNHRVVTIKDTVVSYLPNEKFIVSSIDLLTPLVNDRWVSLRTFNLS